MDTTQGIVKVWHLCSPKQRTPDDPPVGALPLATLKIVIEQELTGRLHHLADCSSADDVLREYMRPDATGLVGFLQYWQGMEQIMDLLCRGTRRNLLSPAKQEALEGFHYLRRCILEMSSTVSQDRAVLEVRELRYFISRTMNTVGESGQAFWQAQAERLEASDDCLVTGEEVATALLQWLEELLEDDAWDCPAPSGRLQASGHGDYGGSSASSSYDSEASLDEGRMLASESARSSLGYRPASAAVSGSTRYHADERAGRPRVSDIGSHAGAGGHWPPPAPPLSDLEASLGHMLRRAERRPGSPTKEAAAEWRDGMAFNSALTKALTESQERNEAFTFQCLYLLACDHFAASQMRRRRTGASPIQQEKLHWRAVRAMCALLEGLVRKRKAEGFGAWLALRRLAAPGAGATSGGDGDIYRELLRSQCQTALALEKRVTAANRAGALVLCVARVQRARLRSAWVELLQLNSAGRPKPDACPNRCNFPSDGFAGALAAARREEEKHRMPEAAGETQQLTQLLAAFKS